MKVKKLLRGEKARIKLKEGIDTVANYTKVTLGPKGRNVALNQFGPLPTRVVNDGVTIAEEIKSEDPYIQAGVEMVQEICRKTNQNAGDGTTQTALLAQAIINEGQKRLVAGYNPIDLKKEIEEDLESMLDIIKDQSKPVKDIEDIRNLATISGNNDKEIGDALADIMKEVGMNASILIDKGSEAKIKIETVKGIYFDQGFRVPAFINNMDKGIAEYKNPNIFIVNENIRYDDDIKDFFIKCSELDFNNIVIIAKEIEGEALITLALTHKAKYTNPEKDINVNLLAIQAPFIGPDQEDFMEDLACYINGKVISNLNEVKDPREVVGTCERLVANSKNTTIIGGSGSEENVKKKIVEIKNLIEQTSPSEKTIREKLEKRKDVLESGVGIIYAGGATEIEIKDRLLRLEDAVLASKSAVKEGYIQGGGLLYLLLSQHAKTDIMRNALKIPTWQIAYNAGKTPEMVVADVLKGWKGGKEVTVGYNAKTDVFEDLIKAGVIDATLVLKNALKNAVSLACMFLTTEAIITDFDKYEEGNTGKKPKF